MKKPKYSILIPTYNKAEYLQYSIKSVLNSDYQDFELIVSNDFSDDYYLETLFKWSPDPYTIFYAGSSQFLNDGEPGGSLQLYTSQIYLKFQYFYQG